MLFAQAEWGEKPRESVTVMPQYADKSDTLAGFVLAQTEHGLFLYLIARAVGFCTGFFVKLRASAL